MFLLLFYLQCDVHVSVVPKAKRPLRITVSIVHNTIDKMLAK